jgi:hypothetical protein
MPRRENLLGIFSRRLESDFCLRYHQAYLPRLLRALAVPIDRSMVESRASWLSTPFPLMWISARRTEEFSFEVRDPFCKVTLAFCTFRGAPRRWRSSWSFRFFWEEIWTKDNPASPGGNRICTKSKYELFGLDPFLRTFFEQHAVDFRVQQRGAA